MISFKANYISSANVLQNKNLKSYPQQVSFVELNPHDNYDVVSANCANLVWGGKSRKQEYFGDEICHALNVMNHSNISTRETRFFAITSQLDNFQNLISEKILALTQVIKCNDKTRYIEYLQVAPQYSYNATMPKYRHVGTAMLDSLKKLFCEEDIELDAVADAVKFYLKNGFKDLGESDLTERRMIFERIKRKI